jgi:murein DD-endopeptidase MepM/ murein hydrolase activator NlpD
MAKLGMNTKEQTAVKEKYLIVDYDFLIGFKSIAGDYNQLYSGEFLWPVPTCNSVSSPYGMRLHPTLKTQRMHYGIDIPAPEGTQIIAPSDGMIMSYTPNDAVGWTMVIDHGTNEQGQRIETRYCHLLNKTVNVGQIVREGSPIARVGNTGYLSTGPHLHFEVYIDGVTVDPAEFFTKEGLN